MNILFVMPNLTTSGGITRSSYDLLPALHALGVQPFVACLADREPSMRGAFEGKGFQVTVLPRDVKAKIRALRQVTKLDGIEIVHTAQVETSVIGRLASVGLPVSVVTSIVGMRKARRRSRQLAYQWTHRFTDRFHAISFAAKSYATNELGIPDERISVVERGRDQARLGSPSIERRLRARAALGINPETPLILTAARQEPVKDQVTLIAAFDRLVPMSPDAILLIAGREGKATSLLLRRLELSAHCERIRILGHRNDVPELMAAADVFGFPSLSEGLGGVVIEAMALGLPVVASDIPAMREVVTEGVTGELVRAGDPDAFARSLVGLLRDPRRARSFGARGRERFLERYTIERSAERMRDLYAEVATRARGGARACG